MHKPRKPETSADCINQGMQSAEACVIGVIRLQNNILIIGFYTVYKKHDAPG